MTPHPLRVLRTLPTQVQLLVAGTFVNKLGGFMADWSWRLLFFGDGGTTLLYGLVVYLYIGETRHHATGAAVGAAGGGGSAPWRDAVFVQMLVVSFAFSLVFFSHITELPLT